MIEAQPGCCQEAAIGVGDAYLPCNKPAVSVVGWRGRTDAPLRMCFACTDHNVRNRGGYIVSVFKPSGRVGVKRDKPNATRQKTDYPAEIVRRYQNMLSNDHVAVLLAAVEANGSYGKIAALLGRPVGTIKSSLNRARKRLANVIQNAVSAPL